MTNARLTSVMCFTDENEEDCTSLVPWWSITVRTPHGDLPKGRPHYLHVVLCQRFWLLAIDTLSSRKHHLEPARRHTEQQNTGLCPDLGRPVARASASAAPKLWLRVSAPEYRGSTPRTLGFRYLCLLSPPAAHPAGCTLGVS